MTLGVTSSEGIDQDCRQYQPPKLCAAASRVAGKIARWSQRAAQLATNASSIGFVSSPQKSLRILAIGICTVIAVTAGCSSKYEHTQDFAPTTKVDASQLKEPIPKTEAISLRGNASEYKVRGRTYRVNRNIIEYSERGIASWYGMKFHGHETSNGEIYDVHRFTAAHKNLPLPSYVRVTREDNGKSVIVRVNDRGPFIKGRIIDLSYVAAQKIGLDKSGVAPVRVELLKAPVERNAIWVQTSAHKDKHTAQKAANQLRSRTSGYSWPVTVVSDRRSIFHKVRVGPFTQESHLKKVIEWLSKNDMDSYLIIRTAGKPQN